MTETIDAETTAIVTREVDRAPTKLSLFDMEPKEQIAKATEMANALADVIEKQKLYSNIQGKKYVKVEGWELLGAFLGILPRESSVVRYEDGSYEARVDLIRTANGCVVGGASAVCGVDEKRWKGADEFARRSMAVTRAVGKAYRCSFSWILTLSGYDPTPAEELEEVYSATDIQKVALTYYAEKAGVTKKEALKEVSDFCIGKPIRDLQANVKSYLENPMQ